MYVGTVKLPLRVLLVLEINQRNKCHFWNILYGIIEMVLV